MELEKAMEKAFEARERAISAHWRDKETYEAGRAEFIAALAECGFAVLPAAREPSPAAVA